MVEVEDGGTAVVGFAPETTGFEGFGDDVFEYTSWHQGERIGDRAAGRVDERQASLLAAAGTGATASSALADAV